MFKISRAFLVLLPLLSGGFAAEQQSARSSQFILPIQTDSAITRWNLPHLAVVNKHVPSRGKLFVFLPGTRNFTFNYSHIVNTAADAGFHALALHYPNDSSITKICGKAKDLTCFEKARLEIITGKNLWKSIQISRENAVIHRLEKLLDYLRIHYPEDGWGQYLDRKKKIRWNKVVMAGHSQGGGHAAMIAKNFRVDRVIMFSSADFSRAAGKPAPWLSRIGRTPAYRFYGFGHARDRAFPVFIQLSCWKKLSILSIRGRPADADGARSGWKSSRGLMTDAPPATITLSKTPFHNAVIVDYDTPKDRNGEALYRDVWLYLLTGEVK